MIPWYEAEDDYEYDWRHDEGIIDLEVIARDIETWNKTIEIDKQERGERYV